MLNVSSARLNTDKLPLNVQLMPHQKAMVHRMLDIEKGLIFRENAFGMMSDKPGSGKTYAVLAFLYVTNKIIFKGGTQVNIIVVPYNICTQWKTSMEKLYGPSDNVENKMKYMILTEYQDVMMLYSSPGTLLNHDILLTTSMYFSHIASSLKSLKLNIHRVLFDEADTIQNLLSMPLECSMTWFISASMASLFKNDKSKPVAIGNYKINLNTLLENNICCEPDFINMSIILPEPIVIRKTCKNVYFELLCLLMPGKLDHLHAIDYSIIKPRVIDEMYREIDACINIYMTSISSNITNHQLLQILQKEHEDAIRRGLDKRALSISNQIDACKGELARCKFVFESFIKFLMLDIEVEEFTGLEQDHVIHLLDTHKDNIEQINLDKIDVIHELLEAIAKTQNFKCIVFSNYDYVYRYLRAYLKQNGIAYCDLDGGNIKDMDTIIEKYKRDNESCILFADSTMYSCGMNLENTTDIVFIHRLDKQREKQVIGRAQRYGRKDILRIHYIDYV